LLIDFDEATGLFDLARLERKLQEALGCPVDVVPASNLHPNVQARILREAVPL
jgi:predicted nucleotidyltransferase